uniref:COMM domain containing 9 n=1 Tax=Sinocyclocheilus rhinocerous TaxID=307959 RepID=A0A673KGG0_9TELE
IKAHYHQIFLKWLRSKADCQYILVTNVTSGIEWINVHYNISFIFIHLQLLTAFHMLSHHVVYQNLTSPEQVLSLFPESFHSNLKNLITKILLENSVTWRNEALSSQISLPKLVDLEWRVDMKTASDSLSRMAVPTCLLQMKLQDTPCISGSPSESTVTMELSKETLDTMIDGLGRIRDQLSAVARK